MSWNNLLYQAKIRARCHLSEMLISNDQWIFQSKSHYFKLQTRTSSSCHYNVCVQLTGKLPEKCDGSVLWCTALRFIVSSGGYSMWVNWRSRLGNKEKSLYCWKESSTKTPPVVWTELAAISGLTSDPLSSRVPRSLPACLTTCSTCLLYLTTSLCTESNTKKT